MILLLLLQTLLLFICHTQTTPIFQTAKSLYVGADQASLTTTNIQSFTVTFPSGFVISTLGYRKPFVGISSVSDMAFETNENLYYFLRINSVMASSMVVELENYIASMAPVVSYGFTVNAVVKYRYLLVKNTMPDIYFSDSLSLTPSATTLPSNGLLSTVFQISTVMPSATPITLTSSTTFLYTLSQLKLTSQTSPLQNSFSIKFAINSTSSSQFKIKATTKYPCLIGRLNLFVMAFNEGDFMTNFQIRVEVGYFTFANLQTQMLDYYTAMFLPAVGDFMYGLMGLEFDNVPDLGFQFLVDSVVTANDFKLVLNNLVGTTIPKLQFLLLVVSQLVCPTSQLLINQALTQCYAPIPGCPTATFASTTQLGLTGIFYCLPCAPTCETCTSTTPITCVTCYASQNRALLASNNSCMPLTHYYDDGTLIAKVCDANCKECSIAPTNCTQCNGDQYLSPTNSCVLCSATYNAQCLTCTQLTCLTCSGVFFVGLDGKCIDCLFFHAQCATCNKTQCLTCNTGFYPIGGSCKPCTDFHAQCTICTPTGCTTCTAPYQPSPTKQCVNCTDYDPQCLTCDSSQCLTCNPGFYAMNSACKPCSDFHPQCTACTNISCSTCTPPYQLNPTLQCTNCTDFDPQCLTCTGTACSTCNTGFYLIGNVCLHCTNFHPQCTACSSTACTFCTAPYYAKASSGCVSCPDYHIKCATCSGAGCTSCATGYYLKTNTCPPCTNYHTKCLTCTATECSTCTPPFFVSATKGCINCTDYHASCLTCTASACTSCSPSLYPNGMSCTPCTNYHAQCTTCSTSACTACSGSYMVSNLGKCVTCTDYHAQCLTCTGSTCLTCAVGYYKLGISCANCTNYHTQCTQCTPTACTQCGTGFMVSSVGQCVSCSDYHTHCTQCAPGTCTQCAPAYALSGITCIPCSSFHFQCNTCDATTCQACDTGYFLTGTTCQSCISAFNQQCQACTPATCLTCEPKFFVDVVTSKCLRITCGDGRLIDGVEECDDGNLDNFDGCDEECKVEPDYVCLPQDMYPNRTSLCKYTKPINITFSYFEKEATSNIVHLYFTIQPPTFKQWSPDTIKALLSPISLFKPATRLLTQSSAMPQQSSATQNPRLLQSRLLQTILTPLSIDYQFHRSLSTEQIEIIIDYGLQSFEGTVLSYSISPGLTSITSISFMSAQSGMTVMLDSTGRGAGLYGYTADVYHLARGIQVIAWVIGILSLGFLLLGCVLPVGRLIVVQALAVVQLAYFSILQFDQIPPTFLAFKRLIYANGYNMLPFSVSTGSLGTFNTYTLLGLKQGILPNFNLSFFLLVITPLVIGLIGLCVVKLKSPSEENLSEPQKDSKRQSLKQHEEGTANISFNTTEKHSLTMLKSLAQRTLFQGTFYGLMATAYLSFTLIFSNFSGTSNIIFLVFIFLVWILYAILFFRQQSKTLYMSDLVQRPEKDRAIPPEYRPSLVYNFETCFGQFKQVHELIIGRKLENTKFMSRAYFLFVTERFVSSIIIVLVGKAMRFGSALIIVIFVILLGLMMNLWRKSQKMTKTSERKGLCSYMYQNYTLRQLINLSIIIVIQTLYLTANALVSMNGIEQTIGSDMFVIKAVPLLVIILVTISLSINIAFYISQLRSVKPIKKGKIIFSILFPSSSKPKLLQLSFLQQTQNTSSQPIAKSKAKTSELTGRSLQQEDQMKQLLNSYINTSPIFKNRNSPFIGLEQNQKKRPQRLQPQVVRTIYQQDRQFENRVIMEESSQNEGQI